MFTVSAALSTAQEDNSLNDYPVPVTQEEGESPATHPVPTKRRRSSRNTSRIVLADKTSLQYRRLDELFFQNPSRRNPKNVQINSLTLERVHSSPNIYVIDNFLTTNELEHLFRKIQTGRFSKSFVDSEKNEAQYDTSHRTSTFLSFLPQHDKVIAGIEARAAQLLGCFTPQNIIEPLQLVRYLPGQFFGVHHDMGDLMDDGTVGLPRKSYFTKRRLVTIFCYLNHVDQGGATDFPALKVNVQPQPGRAVLFSNIRADGTPEPRTIHAGSIVTKGIKFGLNIWLTE